MQRTECKCGDSVCTSDFVAAHRPVTLGATTPSDFVFKCKLTSFGILWSYEHNIYIQTINNLPGYLTGTSAKTKSMVTILTKTLQALSIKMHND